MLHISGTSRRSGLWRGILAMAVLVSAVGGGAGLALWLHRSPGAVFTTAASAASPQAPGQADTTQEDAADGMPRFRAPEFDGGVAWLNTAGPLRLRDLRGKIVLLDFWTLCCINCIHTLPDLAKLEKKYANQLVVVGVHSAKFDNEKNSESIR
ncbi:MAG TPA: thioredoxin-like domain-containing protein, partial [Gemmataceae bacterium]|nr:thioredoxin-like domain-containing protein [Gemmataceae bacterium]